MNWFLNNVDLIAGGVVGILTFGVIIRNVIQGFNEARAKMASDKITAMQSIAGAYWSQSQIERTVLAIESVAESMVSTSKSDAIIAAAHALMSDKFQVTTQEKLNTLLERMDEAERHQRVQHEHDHPEEPPRRPGGRPRSR